MHLLYKTTTFLSLVFCVLAKLNAECDPGTPVKSDSLLQTRTVKAVHRAQTDVTNKLQQPYTIADSSSLAPAEGGAFSTFFNGRKEGPGIHKWLHYFPAYQRHLGKFIGKEVHIVEIGIQSGGSLDMWQSVFGPKTHVYGCDINPACKAYEDNQTKIFIGDQEDPAFWANFLSQVPRIDILIDDGSHFTEGQVATLGIMLQHLSPEGVFITEDVHEHYNTFWQGLHFENLTSPNGKQYTGLGRLISSVHIYPYLLVVERNQNIGEARATNQTKIGLPEQTSAIRMATLAEALPVAVADDVLPHMREILPTLQWDNQTILESTVTILNAQPMPAEMQPQRWFFIRDGNEQLSLDTPWDAQADAFMSKIILDFSMLHDGTCCDRLKNSMQNQTDSLHFYPHLAVVQGTASSDRSLRAPQHGSQWIPYA